MKVAIIGARGIDSSYGGIEKVLGEICPRLVDMGHEIHVYSEKAPSDGMVTRGVTIRRIPTIPGKYTETISRSLIATVIASLGDYNLINLVGIGSGVFSFVPKLRGKPVVVSCHGLDWQRDKWPAAARAALRFAERTMVTFADEITVVSQQLETYFQARHGRQVAYAPNALDLKDASLHLDELKAFDLEPGEYVLFASRLVPEKGAHELVDAFNEVRTDKKLVIAGGSRYDQSYVQELMKADKSGRCLFTGHVTGPLLDALFGGAYLYVLPSHIEGLSLSLLEAISFGKCTLVSDIPENLEVVGAAGFSFPVGNISALRESLQSLMDFPDQVSAMSARARELALRHPDWDAIAERYSDIYESVVQSKRSPGRQSGGPSMSLSIREERGP